MSSKPAPRKGPAPSPGAVVPSRSAYGPQPAPRAAGRRPGQKPPASQSLPEDAAPAPGPAKKRRPRAKGGEARLRLVEVVFFHHYDIGRSADLKKIAAIIPAHDDLGLVKRRDTPASLQLPRPLVVQLGEGECVDAGDFECVSAQGKIYDDAAITIMMRVKIRVPLRELHTIRERRITSGGREITIGDYAEENFRRLFEAIKPAVSGIPEGSDFDRETYAAYCVIDGEEWPGDLIASDREYIAALLSGEDPNTQLHEAQVAATIGRSFSYRRSDLAIFDLDRCFIVDPSRDYEDLLLIIEHANYQLLELRVLDALLDRWLEEAERDMRLMYSGDKKTRRKLGRSVAEKSAHIQALRVDALFILENLENSSKIIGDYYLGQIYDRLCTIFNTEGWKWSVERRLEALQTVYDMLKSDMNERKILVLEITFIAVCVILPLIQIFQVMIT